MQLKMSLRSCSLAIALIAFRILSVFAESDILGCGGFIKSHADIDFSKVEVKL